MTVNPTQRYFTDEESRGNTPADAYSRGSTPGFDTRAPGGNRDTPESMTPDFDEQGPPPGYRANAYQPDDEHGDYSEGMSEVQSRSAGNKQSGSSSLSSGMQEVDGGGGGACLCA